MTPVFLFTIMGTVAVVGLLIVALVEHVRKYDKAEELQKSSDDVDESIANAEAGFDWKRAA